MNQKSHLLLGVVQEGHSLKHLCEEGRRPLDEYGQEHLWPALSVLRQLLGPLLAHHTAFGRVPSIGDVVTKVVEVELQEDVGRIKNSERCNSYYW